MEISAPAAGEPPEKQEITADPADTDRIKSLIRQGRMSLGHEEYDEALKSLLEAYELNPQNHETIHSVMAVHVRKGDYAAAAAFLEQAAERFKQESDREEINQILALIYFKQAQKDDKNGTWDKSETSLYKAVTLDPQSPRYLIALARMRHKAGSFDDAEALLNEGLVSFVDGPSRQEIKTALEKIRLNEAILRKIR